jgi:hypothetical protein
MVPDLNRSQTSETVFLLGHRGQRGIRNTRPKSPISWVLEIAAEAMLPHQQCRNDKPCENSMIKIPISSLPS